MARLNPRARQLLQIAHDAAADAQGWEDIHNAVYGVGGPFSQLFPTKDERVAFAKLPEHKEIQDLIRSRPRRSGNVDNDNG